MKRIVTIQDISCVGKCSLTVALPLISALGVETAVIPTAVLSSHTAFSGFSIQDLTGNMKKVSEHWKKEKLDFDCIYTGYLASEKQLETVSHFIDDFGADAYVFVDPVMGDFGRLYTGFSPDFPQKMAVLCAAADMIVPNITEACSLTNTPHKAEFTLDEIGDMAKKLCSSGTKSAVITGVSPSPDKLGVLKYDGVSGKIFTYFGENIKTGFPLHGTGDIFSSVCVGAMTRGLGADDALALACDFTAQCVRATAGDADRRWYGVNFESEISCLCRMLEERLNGRK